MLSHHINQEDYAVKIPKRFKLFGRTIEVVFDPLPFVERSDCSGFASYRLGQIELNPSQFIYGKPDQKEQTFYHELMHFILYHAGSSYKGTDNALMHQDEEFVDLCGNLLHQAISTMEFEA